MINTRKLLTAYNGWWSEDVNLTTAAIKYNANGLPMGFPIVINRGEYDKAADRDKSIRTGYYFPLYADSGSVRRDMIIGADSIYFTDPKNIVDGRRIKVIDNFEFDKLPKIQELLKSEGALTFIIDELEASKLFISNLKEFTKYFEWSTSFGLKRHTDKMQPPVEGDTLSVFVDMYDLPYAIPVIENRRANGMGVNIGLFWKKYSAEAGNHLYITDEYQFAVNDHEANLLKMDGEVIRHRGLMGDSIKMHLTELLTREALRRKKDKDAVKKQEKQPEKKKRSAVEGVPVPPATHPKLRVAEIEPVLTTSDSSDSPKAIYDMALSSLRAAEPFLWPEEMKSGLSVDTEAAAMIKKKYDSVFEKHHNAAESIAESAVKRLMREGDAGSAVERLMRKTTPTGRKLGNMTVGGVESEPQRMYYTGGISSGTTSYPSSTFVTDYISDWENSPSNKHWK